MKQILYYILVLIVGASNALAQDDQYTVGIGRKIITPKTPAWLTGYAARDKPSEIVAHDLWAKAVAIEGNGDNVIIVTTDLLGLSHEISEEVASVIQKKYGIKRSAIMFNSSHTHSGPMVWPNLSVISEYDMANQEIVSAYGHLLTQSLIEVIEMALKNRKPMNILSGNGKVGFAINRRPQKTGGMENGQPLPPPVDHDVPVLKIETTDGQVQAVLFAYACHNTTVTGSNYSINGDYAGFAQIELEKAYPGSTAMFIMGCGGDQNPFPRGTLELANEHGTSLANEIKRVMQTKLDRLKPFISTALTTVDLKFKAVDIKTFQQDITGNNVFLQRRAKLMLQAYNKGWDVSSYPYPVQALRLSKDLAILALAGEVVVDYALQAKKKYGQRLIVAGYSNEVTCYIPTKRILDEGGYEADQSMIYYGMQGPFADNVESTILKAIDDVMERTKSDSVVLRNKNISNVKGTYGAPPRKSNGRVDIKRLISELNDINANTYHWLIWQNENDWNDLQKFLPIARKENINLWVTIVPPSESQPIARWSSEPFRMDYLKWAAELAKLSLTQTNLVAWSIDDFVHNLALFTPEYTAKMVESARKINPSLAFIPCCYYRQITPGFANRYGHLFDGILFPYRAESVKADLQNSGAVQSEIKQLRSLFNRGFPIYLDVYATAHSRLGSSTAGYVEEVVNSGINAADGVLIYCHQNPEKASDKYQVIKNAFKTNNKKRVRTR